MRYLWHCEFFGRLPLRRVRWLRWMPDLCLKRKSFEFTKCGIYSRPHTRPRTPVARGHLQRSEILAQCRPRQTLPCKHERENEPFLGLAIDRGTTCHTCLYGGHLRRLRAKFACGNWNRQPNFRAEWNVGISAEQLWRVQQRHGAYLFAINKPLEHSWEKFGDIHISTGLIQLIQ